MSSKSLPKVMADHVAEKLRDFMTKEGWTQDRVAEAIGCSQNQVSAARNGKGIGPSFLIAFSRITGRTINNLLGPTAPLHEIAYGEGIERLDKIAASAIFAAAAFVEIQDKHGIMYSGPPGERYRAMRELTGRALNRAQIEQQVAIGAALAADRVSQTSTVFSQAAERASRAARAAEVAVDRARKAG